MQTFGRLLSVLTFLLSLGFIAQALPAPVRSGALSVRQYSAPTPDSYSSGNNYTPSNEGGNYSGYDGSNPSKSDVLALVLGLKADLDPKLALLAKADTIDVAKVQVEAVVGLIKATRKSLVGLSVQVAAEVKAKIAQVVIEIFIAIVSACAAVSVKLGASVCLHLWAQIDVALHLLFLTLNVCVAGLLKVIVELLVKLDVDILAKLNILHLELCVKIPSLGAKLAGLHH